MNESENEKMIEEMDINELTPEELGEIEAELTDLINQTQDLIDECDEELGGADNE